MEPLRDHDDGPSKGRIFHSRLADGTEIDSIEVRSEWNGVWTRRLGTLSIKEKDGVWTALLYEEKD
jgi:hypothetical protein